MRKYIFIISTVLSVAPIMAQEKDSVDLQTSYREQALNYSHDVKASQKNILRKEEMVKSAKKDYLPKLSGGADYQYINKPYEVNMHLPNMDSPLSLQGQHNKYGMNVNLVQPIYQGGLIRETTRLAKTESMLAQSQANLEVSDVSYQADVRYWSAVAYQEVEQVMQRMNSSVSDLVRIVSERVDEELVAANDLLMAEVKLNDADYQLLQAQKNAEVARLAMNSFVGLDFSEFIPMDKEVVVLGGIPPLQSWSEYYGNRPELQIAEQQVEVQQSLKKINDSKFKPKISIGVGGDYSSPGYNFNKDMDWNYGVYASVKVPLFEWGKRGKERKAFDYSVGMAQDYLKKTFDSITLEVQSTYYTLQEAVKQVELTYNSLEKAARNESMALERYVEGLVSITEVLDAQLFHQLAQVNYVQSKLNAQIASSNFNRVLGLNHF